MRSPNKSRSRNKNNNRRSVGNVVNRVFESSGPEGKVRGTPQQIIEKYTALARDAQLAGDRVAAENFQQHAEHYTRLLGEAMREANERREQQEAQAAERREQQEAQAAERREQEARRRAEREAQRADQQVQDQTEADQSAPDPQTGPEDAPNGAEARGAKRRRAEGTKKPARTRKTQAAQAAETAPAAGSTDDALAVVDDIAEPIDVLGSDTLVDTPESAAGDMPEPKALDGSA